MPAHKIEQFGGMLPAWDPHLLPPGQAEQSTNGYLFSGHLEGWRQPKLLRNLSNPNAKYAYRVPNIPPGLSPKFNNNILEGSTWLEFTDQDTNVVKSPVVDDGFARFYFASPSMGPPQYNTTARILANLPNYQLGVPAPGCTPSVTVNGGGNVATLPLADANAPAGNNNMNFNANWVYLVPIIPNGTMELADVQLAVTDSFPSARFAAVLYEDAVPTGVTPTKPGTLMALGDIQVGINAANMVAPFGNPPGLLQSVPYWIGIITDTQLSQVNKGDPASANTYAFPATFTNGPPSQAPSPGGPSVTTGGQDFQMWGDFATGDVIESRAYVYTWVTAYGEEGPPSLPTLVNGWSNGTWEIGTFCPQLNEMGSLMNIAVIRLYRTVPGTSGSTVYYFVTDIDTGNQDPDARLFVQNDALPCVPPPPNSFYADTALDSVIALNNQLPSLSFFPPPADLQGIISMPNGMVAGFRNNEIWFCEPYRPHAWPPEYVITTEFPIVGLGLTLSALVATTASNAYVAQGVNPSSMTLTKCAVPEPCLSRGSIMGTDQGVYFMSPNGLILVQYTGQQSNTTESWITREKWQNLTPQKYARAVPIVGCYMAFGSTFNGDVSTAQDGFVIQHQPDQASFSIWPQPGGHRVGFQELTSFNNFNIDNLLIDPFTGIPFFIQNGQIWYFDFSDPAPTMVPYTFRSKRLQQTTKKNYEAMKIFFTVPPNSPTPGTRNEAAFNDPSWNTLGPTQLGIVRVFADYDDGSGDGAMQLVTCREIQKSGELLRIDSGFKAETWQFEITGRIVVSNIQFATSAKELGSV